MSTNKTKNYQLHAWEPGDDFLLSEINENFAMLDQTLAQGLGEKVEMVTGTYVGDGAESRLIALDFIPRALLVMHESGGTNVSGYLYGGLILPGEPAIYSNIPYVSIVEGGFQVSRAYLVSPPSGYYANANILNTKYRYLAFR